MSEIINTIFNTIKKKQSEVTASRTREILNQAAEAVDKSEAVAKVSKKVLKGTAAGVIVASILVGLTFNGTAEITGDQAATKYNQTPIVMDIDDYANATVDDDDDDAADEKTRKIGIVARFKQAILSLPQTARLLVVAPLWIFGTGILTAISFLWNVLFASPLGAVILSAFGGFAILLGLFAVTAKILFPEIPLRKIITGRNVFIIAVAACVMTLIDGVAPLFWHRYPYIAGVIKLGIGALVVAVLAMKVRMIFYRDKYKNLPEAVRV